ncbi:MAG: phosphoserine phosphatase SerB [Actinobacteria bacterium]|uniref:phosphoserine phosphatase n=1 Tax=freshwater metagenome TaxID=449393 RepID=A0A6J6DPX2_9ZZZZ|nr:phosphoserine phosphatase SerB [Actinomycetota bacterium]
MIEQEVIELLAERVGLRDQVKILTDQAMAGEIDFREALLKRVGLLEGLNAKVLEELLAEIRITHGVPELISAVHNSGGLVGAISGGFSQVLELLSAKLNLDFFKANNLEIENDVITGKIIGEIVDAEVKARTLLRWAGEYGFDLSSTVAVGDGANDIQMLKASGFAVAFRPKEVLRDHADLIIEGDSLEPLISVLELRPS